MGSKTGRKRTKAAARPKLGRHRTAPKARTAATGGLTAAQILSLPKPRTNYEELIDKAVAAWRRHSEIRVPGVTAAKLASLVSSARRAQAAQDRVEAAFEKRLRPVRDRRLVADATAWRALLDLWAFAKPAGRRIPGVAEDFRFLEEALATPRVESRKQEPAPA